VIVIDASAILELLLGGPASTWVAARIAGATHGVHAPELLDLEVAQVLRRLEKEKSISTSRAKSALADYADLDVQRYSHRPFLDRVWALRANATAYDAAYLALAEGLDAPLVTLDVRLARSAGHRARVQTP
jgi:predicted nucleic acid-binding protein